MNIFETSAFETDADRMLDGNERRAVHLLLADNPMCGASHAQLPGLWELQFSGYTIAYSIRSLQEVYLLSIERSSAAVVIPTPAQSSLVKSTLNEAVKAGAVMVVKEGLRYLWEVVKAHLH